MFQGELWWHLNSGLEKPLNTQSSMGCSMRAWKKKKDAELCRHRVLACDFSEEETLTEHLNKVRIKNL